MTNAKFQPGKIIKDRYRIARYIGSGAMGDVYQAEDIKHGTHVALKFIKESGTPGDDTRQKVHVAIRKEFELSRRVVHHHVCQTLDLDLDVEDPDPKVDDKYSYLVLQYIAGTTFVKMLERQYKLPYDRIIEYGIQLCDALQAVHNQGVIHRDLKPGNIALGVLGEVRLMDFGLAAWPGVTREFAGTPIYMAPEQLDGGAVSKKTDIFSLGLFLLELNTREKTFRYDLNKDLIGNVPLLLQQHEDLRRKLSSPGSEITRGFDELILRCLDHEPSQRPASAARVAERLESLRKSRWAPVSGQEVPENLKYKLKHQVGDWAFGPIWLAESRGSQGPLLIKICAEPANRRELYGEHQRHKSFATKFKDGSGVARIRNVAPTSFPPFMEIVRPGGDLLEKWIRNRGGFEALAEKTKLGIFLKIVEIIDIIHSAGLDHLDIRPGVIYVDGSIEEPRITLRDVGPGLRRPGSRGVWDFVPPTNDDPSAKLYWDPELRKSDQDLEVAAHKKADTFSLGILLYHLLVGDFSRPPINLKKTIPDDLLREDVRNALRRDISLSDLAKNIRDLEKRRAKANKTRRLQKKLRNRRRTVTIMSLVLIAVSLAALATAYFNVSLGRKNRTIETYASFMEETLRLPDPVRGYGARLTALQLLDEALVLAEERLTEHPDIHTSVHFTVGSAYYELGRYNQAKETLNRALAAQRAGRSGKQITETLWNLARTHWRLSDYSKAEKRINDALGLATRTEGDESVEVARYSQTKADILYDLGQVEEAGKLYLKASEMSKRLKEVGKTDNLQVAEALNNLAFFMADQGQFTKSRNTLLEARKLLSKDDFMALAVEYALANFAFEKRDYKDAKKRYEWVLEATQKRFDAHQDLAHSLSGLGVYHLEMGEFARAEKLLDDALAMNREVWPDGNLEIVDSQLRLGGVLAEQGRYEEAKKHLREALGFLEENFENNYFRVHTAKEILAQVLGDLGSYEESEGYYRELLDAQSAEEQDLVQLTKNQLDLAVLLWDQGREADARNLSERALETLSKQKGKTSIALAANREKLGNFSRLSGDLDEAGRWYLEAYETYTAENPAAKDQTAEDASATEDDSTTEIDSTAEDSMDMVRAARVKREIALLRVRRGEAEGAQVLLDECRTILEEIFPLDHWRYSMIKAVEAARLSRLGEDRQAETLFSEALQELASKKGKEARETRMVKELSTTYTSN